MDFKPPFNDNRQAKKPSYKYKNKRILWFNSANADDVFNTNEYMFNIRPFQIFNNSVLRPISFVSEANDKSFNIIRIKDISYDVDGVIMTDKKEPILLVANTGVESQFINNDYSLTLPPQQINKITLINDKIVTNINYFSYSPFRQYPSKTYNSFTTPVSTTFNDRPCFRQTIFLNNSGITYGDGTYNIWVLLFMELMVLMKLIFYLT